MGKQTNTEMKVSTDAPSTAILERTIRWIGSVLELESSLSP